ncbi:hypothetical protein [Actinomadura fibrosa]|uniref:Uncharacterized protein n=3 Tax=Actinomadura fibrosa TaxID=111802 RepID=A0ABW2XYY9_9ACTN
MVPPTPGSANPGPARPGTANPGTADPGPARPGERTAVYLHIGAAKSGTTYLQQAMWGNRHRLRERGVLYPGDDHADHVKAAFDLRGTFFRGARDPSLDGAWRQLVERARDWRGTVIISQELFAPAEPEHVARALADLDFADVHLVFTARDLARQIPAHWQEDAKNRLTASFGEFVADLKRPNWHDFESARLFWELQDPVDVLARWGAADLPPGRVHLVTVPRPGAPHDLLWRRFCAAVGIDPDGYDLGDAFANPSLGLAETQFLLRLNRTLGDDVSWSAYNLEIKHRLAQDVLTERPGRVRIDLPAEHVLWATERAVEMVEDLRAAGYRVVGDLYELVPTAVPAAGSGTVPGAPGSDPDEPYWADVADVGTDAVAALLRRVLEWEERSEAVPGGEMPVPERIGALRAETSDLLDRTGRLVHDASPLALRAARNVSERYPAVRRLRGAYRRLHPAADPSDDVESNAR